MFNILFLFLVAVTSCEEEWVWKDGDRSSKNSRNASPRYDVSENYDDFHRQNRPIFGNQPAPEYFNPARPGGSYGQNNYPVRPGYGQGLYTQVSNNEGSYNQGPHSQEIRPDHVDNFGPDGHPGILTGPVPSWQKGQPFRHFDTCKCTEKFNCNRNGVAYGHCDVGKQYCCHSRKYGPAPSRPVHSPENGILIGPGGPADRPGRYPERPHNPIRETYDGGPYEGDAGILIGPGGPTGIVGRPPKGGSLNSYGSYNSGFFGRSNKN